MIEALEDISVEYNTQVLISTHSPHIARGASFRSKLVWIHDGAAKSEDEGRIKRLLGWGGLDRELLFFVEDEDDQFIRALLRQWPHLTRRVGVCRCFGVDNLPKDKLLEGLISSGDFPFAVVIHRDRDFMTDDECDILRGFYKTQGVDVWVTRRQDVESYFVNSRYLAKLFSVDRTETFDWIKQAATAAASNKQTFSEKRRRVNRELWPDGGGPGTTQLWEELENTKPQNVMGKAMLGRLKQIIHSAGHDSKKLDRLETVETLS